MYEVCPKCEYCRQPSDPADTDSCPRCGIIYAKWLKQQLQPATGSDISATDEYPGRMRQFLSLILDTGPAAEPAYIYGRTVILIIFLVWGWQFIMMDFNSNPYEIGQSFMHNINLVFHEAGHVFFRPFGWFMTIAGGSIFQLLVPLFIMFFFIFRQHDNFAASIAMWWTGQSFMDLAPYIDDAMEQKLVLLGGQTGADAPGNHDWNNILIEFNHLEKCHDYATIADTSGTILMLIAFGWGGYILYRQYQVSF